MAKHLIDGIGRNHGLRHPIMQQGLDAASRLGRQRPGCLHVINNTALDAHDAVQPAMMGDVGGLARPGRDGAQTRHDQTPQRCGLGRRGWLAIIQDQSQTRQFLGIEFTRRFDQMNEHGVKSGDGGLHRPNIGQQAVTPKLR